MDIFILAAIFIVLFISTNIIEKSLKKISDQNKVIIKILNDIHNDQEKK